MKAFGSNEAWESPGNIKTHLRADSKNALHGKRISEAEALQQFRKTGNLDSQGFPVQNNLALDLKLNRVQYSEFELPAGFNSIEGAQVRAHQDPSKGLKGARPKRKQ